MKPLSLDLDDDTLDGNQLQLIGNSSSTDANNDGIADTRLATDALRLLPTDFTGGDADGNGKAGNGRVDMADFRRFRDLLLRSEGLGANVTSSNPKLTLGAGSSVLQLADFNGSEVLGFNERKAVSDLETGGFVATGFNTNSGAALLSSSLAAEAPQVVRGLQAGNAARALLKPALEAVYRVAALDDDTNPDTNFSLTASNVNVPYGTNQKITYRNSSEWHHQIFCSVPLRCTSSGAGLLRTMSDSRIVTLTAPIAVAAAPARVRPRF